MSSAGVPLPRQARTTYLRTSPDSSRSAFHFRAGCNIHQRSTSHRCWYRRQGSLVGRRRPITRTRVRTTAQVISGNPRTENKTTARRTRYPAVLLGLDGHLCGAGLETDRLGSCLETVHVRRVVLTTAPAVRQYYTRRRSFRKPLGLPVSLLRV